MTSCDSRQILGEILSPSILPRSKGLAFFGSSVATGLEAIKPFHRKVYFLDIECRLANGFDLLIT